MQRVLRLIAGQPLLRRLVPRGVKSLVRRGLPMYQYNLVVWEKSNPFVGTPAEWASEVGSQFTLGILFDYCHYHANYMAACHELGVSYRVVDITTDDWIERVKAARCDAFLVWPSVYTTLWKQLFDERIRLMVEDLGLTVYPFVKELWLYESKRRIRDWLVINRIPHPRTWVFFAEEEALQFLDGATFPLVFKADRGASSRGVVILEDARRAARLTRRCFRSGFVPDLGDPRDRQWGCVILQEFIDAAHEWRMVRIDDTYLCRLKEKVGRFYSGSGRVRWAQPSRALLDLTRRITDIGGFRSMNVDYFETEGGELLVNELHALFGGIEKANLDRGEPEMGRWLYDPESDAWRFEPGFFYDNACANLRVRFVIEELTAAGPSRHDEST